MKKANNIMIKKKAMAYLKGKVGMQQTYLEFFVYLLDDPKLSKFKVLLENDKADSVDSTKIISIYLKRKALLHSKIVFVGDLCGITNEDDFACFEEEIMANRNRIESIDKTEIIKLKAYIKKVNDGLSVENALKQLKITPDILNYETVTISTSVED